MYPDAEQQKRLLPLQEEIAKGFDKGDWLKLGTMTGCIDAVRGHDRLLRSLSWGDPDYSDNVLDVLLSIVQRDPKNLAIIESYVTQNLDGAGGETLSSAPGGRKIYITPQVFDVPEEAVNRSLVSVMMPFDEAFSGAHDAIKQACSDVGLRCQRVDDIWEKSALIQDIFALICRSFIVICDLTDRNPNVFYEAGIAHALGKHVVPIAQHKRDVPFDLQHHRYLQYLNNSEGLQRLRNDLGARLRTLNDNGVPTFSMP